MGQSSRPPPRPRRSASYCSGPFRAATSVRRKQQDACQTRALLRSACSLVEVGLHRRAALSRRHAAAASTRLFHSFGIAEGLRVIRSGARQVTVKAGFGDRPRSDARSCSTADRVPRISANAGQRFPPARSSPSSIAYLEAPTDPSTDTGAAGNTRVTETPTVQRRDHDAAGPTAAVIRLARFVMTGAGDVPGATNDASTAASGRPLARSSAPGAIAETTSRSITGDQDQRRGRLDRRRRQPRRQRRYRRAGRDCDRHGRRERAGDDHRGAFGAHRQPAQHDCRAGAGGLGQRRHDDGHAPGERQSGRRPRAGCTATLGGATPTLRLADGTQALWTRARVRRQRVRRFGRTGPRTTSRTPRRSPVDRRRSRVRRPRWRISRPSRSLPADSTIEVTVSGRATGGATSGSTGLLSRSAWTTIQPRSGTKPGFSTPSRRSSSPCFPSFQG